MNSPITTVPASLDHQKFKNDVLALLRKHEKGLSSAEMLAVTAQLLGQVVAYQDQRTMTPKQAMEIVSYNMAIGNQEAVLDFVGRPPAGHA